MFIISLDDDGATDGAQVGGKGANLATLSGAGFSVPPAFVISTAAYREFVATSSLKDEFPRLLGQLDFDDAQNLEDGTAAIRAAIIDTALPDTVSSQIAAAYTSLGSDGFVAIRSSGTAEDLADSSFAGLHDTFLDVRGVEEVLDAVRRCWASMWTARATAYRRTRGFDQTAASIAVVVQVMVNPAVAGVLFTGNPLNTATDELMVNASWGLGESVVSGEVTPDQFVLYADTLEVRDQIIGTKTIKIIRDPSGGSGTVKVPVAAEEQNVACLSGEQLNRLGDLGVRIQRRYGGFPQDVEWAYCDGKLHVLQSRPITGVEFSWDAELDASQPLDEGSHDHRDGVWTRAMADSFSTNAISPFMYSIRFAEDFTLWCERIATLYGLDDIKSTRTFMFHKAEVYFNVDWEMALQQKTVPPALRPYMLDFCAVPPSRRSEFLSAPFDYLDFCRRLVRIAGDRERRRLYYGMLSKLDDWRENRRDEVRGLRTAELSELTDTSLKRYIDRYVLLFREFGDDVTYGFVASMRDSTAALAWMVANWYDGTNPAVLIDLLSGSQTASDTQLENHELWSLASDIVRDAELSSLFAAHPGADFFERLAHSPGGREFLEKYHRFVEVWGHRGAEERDTIFPRRADDPAIDYETLRALINASDKADPLESAAVVESRRASAVDDVLSRIERQPLGRLKAEAFKIVYNFTQKCIAARDNERAFPNDVLNYSIRRGVVELARRLVERGRLGDEAEAFFLSRQELYEYFDDQTRNVALLHAKIAARKRDWERFYNKEVAPPMYLQHRKAVRLDPDVDDSTGVLRGDPTSGGVVTGTARVVSKLSEIGRVKAGDILIAESTDPGWASVFLLIRGAVVSLGGVLSHAACLAREYGLPAVRLDDALMRVPDGATIRVDGNAGEVTILADAGAAQYVSQHVAVPAG